MAHGRPSQRPFEARLRLFVQAANDCEATGAVRESTLKAHITMTGSIDAPLNYLADLGDDDHTRSLLISFRKLILQNEDCNFRRCCRIVETNTTDDAVRDESRDNLKAWDRALQGEVAFAVNQRRADGTLRSTRTERGEGLLRVWINGRVFHDDPDGQPFLASMPRPRCDRGHTLTWGPVRASGSGWFVGLGELAAFPKGTHHHDG